MSQFLPLRANLDWLRKSAKDRLAKLREQRADAQLSEAQHLLANEYGFDSWKAMVEHVETVREKLQAAFPVLKTFPISNEVVEPNDADLNALLTAVRDGDHAATIEVLARRPGIINAYGPDGQTAIHVAARFNDGKLAIVLLAHNANPYAVIRESGHDALSWGVTCNSDDFVKTLIRLAVRSDLFSAAGAGLLPDVRACFDDEGSLRPNASRTGSSRFADDGARLVCPPIDPQEQVSDALAIAARNGHADVTAFLLTKNPDLGFRSYLGATALHWAYFGGSVRVIEQLVAAGADATCLDRSYNLAPEQFGICVAASWGIDFKVRSLVRTNPSLAVGWPGKATPLHESAAAGHDGVVAFLLQHGADPKAKDSQGRLPRDRALEGNHQTIADLLM